MALCPREDSLTHWNNDFQEVKYRDLTDDLCLLDLLATFDITDHPLS